MTCELNLLYMMQIHFSLKGSSLTSQRGGPGWIPGQFVSFVVDRVALGEVFSEYFGLPLSISFAKCSIFILLLSGQTDEIWES